MAMTPWIEGEKLRRVDLIPPRHIPSASAWPVILRPNRRRRLDADVVQHLGGVEGMRQGAVWAGELGVREQGLDLPRRLGLEHQVVLDDFHGSLYSSQTELNPCAVKDVLPSSQHRINPFSASQQAKCLRHQFFA